MQQRDDPHAIAQPEKNEKACLAEVGLGGEVFLFLHAGGLPTKDVAKQLASLGCFGKPDAHFDLDGPMWSALAGAKGDSFATYLVSLVDRTDRPTGLLSAIIDYRDLLWLEQRSIFQEQLRQRLRVIRVTFLDQALQAFRRAALARSGHDTTPSFNEIAREMIGIEEAEQAGDVFCKRHGQPNAKLWVEDLARPGVPALRGLLARFSMARSDDQPILPIPSPGNAELEAVTAFRAEAKHRHWSHALLPHRS